MLKITQRTRSIPRSQGGMEWIPGSLGSISDMLSVNNHKQSSTGLLGGGGSGTKGFKLGVLGRLTGQFSKLVIGP